MPGSWDCLCAGILVADQICEPIAALPPAGGLALSPRMTFAIGGCAANVAADMAKLGLKVGLSACAGDDLYGREVAERLRASGVDVAGLHLLPEVPTAYTFVLNVRGEDRRFIHCVGANAHYDGTQLTDAELRSAKILYVGGYCLMVGLTPSRVAALFQRARVAGMKTVLDVVLPERGYDWSWLEPVLPVTDYFFPNADEARILTGETTPLAQARRCHAAGAGTVVVTDGPHGAVMVSRDGVWRSGVHNVPAVDATGTGDAFVAGFLWGTLRGADPADCLRYGTALGASCVRQLGATAGVFNERELASFVNEHPLTISYQPEA